LTFFEIHGHDFVVADAAAHEPTNFDAVVAQIRTFSLHPVNFSGHLIWIENQEPCSKKLVRSKVKD
jgi:hypothetical protein